ncbi:abscisic acid 8'-hydroxylase 2-like [Cynara cardunculus var. scolymus]|uniref:abscisic acid 8'-hydroxylase 2-like n=1 Tax=Cynara cardunculus var. scolymus TaxID=59895 RepID=UPI000D628A03|nr:abscisic acid 8'-hydroxylase 2-like [Cynara cardunculus var. scolymus]
MMSFFPPTPPYLPLLPLVSFLFLLTILIVYSLIRRRCSLPENEKRRLPPGSMGWPYIGETINLYTQNPNTFFSERQNRHGKMFKSHILGCPCVMISSPEVAKIILVTKSDLFKPTYPTSKEMMIGPEALFFHQGQYHSHLKKLIQSSFLPSAIKPLISNIEAIVLDLLPIWEKTKTINTLHEMKKYSYAVAMISVFGKKMEVGEVEGLKELYGCIEKGYNSMPLNVVGTPFNKAMKARKLLNERLRKMIQKRRENGDHGGGLLGVLLGLKGNEQLNDSQIADNIIGVIFAAHDTTASVLTWLLKYLHDHPHLLDAVKMEQEDIKCRRLETNRGITWDDTRHMPLSHRVLQETLRAASILSFTFREAVEDVEIEGYLIPRGWKVLPLFRTIHYCSDFFPDPDKFDPSRFEVAPRANTYMPFGNGAHSCPGSELAKVEMLILLHHLTTSFRWDVVGEDDGIQYGPFPVPKQGLPIKLHRIDET